MFKNKYRIVLDLNDKYEVQIKRWWFPGWFQCHKPGGGCWNASRTIEEAREFAAKHKRRFVVEEVK